MNGIGADSLVTYKPNANPNIMTIDPSSGNVSPAKRPSYIGLAHELIHADRAQRGVTIDLSKKETYKYQTDVVYVKGFWYFSSYWDIIYATEKVRREELATVGLKYNSIWDDITEKDIRAEHS